jgi:NTP pyrophosphatase (non-canonical NTP hydrolase)
MNNDASQILDTLGYAGFVRSLFNRTGDLSKDFTHCVLGVITELHELSSAVQAKDFTNIREEVGDLHFFLEAFSLVLDDLCPINEPVAHDFMSKAFDRPWKADEVNATSIEWMDLCKRWVGYGKVPTMSTNQLLGEMRAFAIVVSAIHSEMLSKSVGYDCSEYFDADAAIVANVAKLMTRYNGIKFNAERAVNRNLEAERQSLEAS